MTIEVALSERLSEAEGYRMVANILDALAAGETIILHQSFWHWISLGPLNRLRDELRNGNVCWMDGPLTNSTWLKADCVDTPPDWKEVGF